MQRVILIAAAALISPTVAAQPIGPTHLAPPTGTSKSKASLDKSPTHAAQRDEVVEDPMTVDSTRPDLSTYTATVIGTISRADCVEPAGRKPGFFRGFGKVVTDAAGEYVGARLGRQAGQSTVGGWQARHAGAALGGAAGRKGAAAAERDPAARESLPLYECQITLSRADGEEAEATYLAPSPPHIGSTVRVHRQTDGTYSNVYED